MLLSGFFGDVCDVFSRVSRLSLTFCVPLSQESYKAIQCVPKKVAKRIWGHVGRIDHKHGLPPPSFLEHLPHHWAAGQREEPGRQSSGGCALSPAILWKRHLGVHKSRNSGEHGDWNRVGHNPLRVTQQEIRDTHSIFLPSFFIGKLLGLKNCWKAHLWGLGHTRGG